MAQESVFFSSGSQNSFAPSISTPSPFNTDASYNFFQKLDEKHLVRFSWWCNASLTILLSLDWMYFYRSKCATCSSMHFFNYKTISLIVKKCMDEQVAHFYLYGHLTIWYSNFSIPNKIKIAKNSLHALDRYWTHSVWWTA